MDDRDRVRQHVAERMRQLGLDATDVATRSGMQRRTVEGFLDGTYWPKLGTLSKLEKTLDWPAFYLRSYYRGTEVYTTDPGPSDEQDRWYVELPATQDGLTRAQVSEVEAVMLAAGLARLRQIQGHDPVEHTTEGIDG